MLTRMIYFGYISLYASLNLIVGIQIIGSFAYNPVIDARHIADLILAVIVLSISVLCFVGLSKRHDNKPRTVNLRRHIGHALTRALLPLLVISLFVNLYISPSVNLLIASILSVLAAATTFLLVRHRLHSAPFQAPYRKK